MLTKKTKKSPQKKITADNFCKPFLGKIFWATFSTFFNGFGITIKFCVFTCYQIEQRDFFKALKAPSAKNRLSKVGLELFFSPLFL